MDNNITIDMRMINSSGIGTYLTNLIPLIISDLGEYHFFLLGHLTELDSFNSYHNVSLIEYNAPIYSIREQFEIFQKVPRNNDLLWIPHFNIPIFYRGKLLVTIHDMFHLAMPQYVGQFVKRIYAKLIFNSIRIKADKIITVSEFSKSEILKHLGSNVQDIIVTENGVNQKWFDVKKENNINTPFILYVGNIKPHKNLSTLIRAFEIIRNEIPHKLIIVGKVDGFITGDNEAIKEAQQDTKRIQFTGFVSDKVLESLVCNADCFVFPSLYEGFGLPPLEAMACGTPVAVSDIPPLKEVCGRYANYFDPRNEHSIADTILNTVTNNKKSESLALGEIKHASTFKWELCAAKTEKVIQELLTT